MRKRPRQTFAASAHHEAGHAVARELLGLAGGVAFVSVDPTDLEGDALGGVWGNRSLAPVRGRAVDHDAVRARCIGLLAGPLAEEKYTGRGQSGCGSDVDQAWDLLTAAYMDSAQSIGHAALRNPDSLAAARCSVTDAVSSIRARFLAMYEEAGAFVETHWSVIEAVARVLARRKRLTGDELRAIVEGSAS